MRIEPEVEELIADAALSAHLATSVEDRPHVAPVWYVYGDGSLWVLTGGKKLENVRRNPRVAVSIERYDGDGVDWGVQLLGTARVVTDEDRIAHVRERMDEVYSGPYGGDGGATVGDDVATDGGETDEYDWALLEIEVASATSQRY